MNKNTRQLLAAHKVGLEADKKALADSSSELLRLSAGTDFRPRLISTLASLDYMYGSFVAPLPSQALVRPVFETLAGTTKRRKERTRLADAANTIIGIALPGFSDLQDGVRTTVALRSSGLTYCQDAEDYFSEVLKFLKGGKKAHQSKLSVYYDPESMHPIAIRKSYEARSALLLEPLGLDSGVVLPPGILIGPDKGTLPTSTVSARGVVLGAYPIEGNDDIEVGRLSAWAYDDATQRKFYAIDGAEYHHSRGRKLNTTLDDFRAAASQIMVVCGLESESS